MYAITKEAARAGLSICLLQEVRYRNSGNRRISLNTGEEYDFFWCGPKRRRNGGIGVLLKVDKNITFSEPDFQNTRIIAMNVTIHGFKSRIVNVYSPTNTDGSCSQKDEFYRNVRKACNPTEKKHKLIIGGDFNAITAVVLRNSCFDGTGITEDNQCNDNGSRLKSFCRTNKFCMIQSYFDVPVSERFTWYSNDGKTKRVLDYILVEKFVQQYTTRCEVKSDYKFDSDHRLVVASLKTPRSKKARWKKKEPKKFQRDLDALKDEDIRKDFIRFISNQMPITDHNDSVDRKSDRIADALNYTANSTLPQKYARMAREIWKEDAELNRILTERAKMERGSAQYKVISKCVKKRVRQLRNQKLKAEAEEINQYASKRQIENLFRTFKDDNHAFKTPFKQLRCDPGKLKDYFYNHFKKKEDVPDPKELQETPTFVKNLKNVTNAINTLPPEEDEIETAMRKLKNGKTSNDYPAAYLKYAADSKEFLKEVTKLFKDIWKTNKVPIIWGHSRLVALWKGPLKGKSDDPATYRGLQVGSTMCKLLVIIIINRMKEWYENQLLDQQQGFRTGRGTTDGLFLAKSLQQIAHKTNRKLYALFVDLTAAFDHIDRTWLFKSIKQRFHNDADCKLIEILEALYETTTTALAGHELETFMIELGVRQGGPESPLLFNLFIDYVMRVFLDECKAQKVRFVKLKFSIPKEARKEGNILGLYGEHVFDWIGYADDLMIAFEDIPNLEKGLNILNNVFKRFKLAMNVSKTKTMIMNPMEQSEHYPSSIVSMDGEEVKNVVTFEYLGSQVRNDEHMTGETEIIMRIDMAEAKFYEHGKKLMNFNIDLSTRILILNSLVRSRLTYGCQTWTLSNSQKGRLNASYMSMIRKMVRGGYKRKTGEWAYKLTNQNLLNICKTENITAFTDRQKSRYLAHLLRLPDTSITKRMVFNADRSVRTGPHTTFLKTILEAEDSTLAEFARRSMKKEL